MPRSKNTLDHYEPVTQPSDENVVTYVDYHTLPSGTFGSRTNYIRRLEAQTSADRLQESTFFEGAHGQTSLHEPLVEDMVPAESKSGESNSGPSKAGKKRRATYNPIAHWIPSRDQYLLEMLRLEGRGDYTENTCPQCRTHVALFRCRECTHGQLLCRDCIKANHICNPLHVLEEWTNDAYFKKISLHSLGFHVQLGHPPGHSCPHPKRSHKTPFVVIDLSGIHEIELSFCDCLGSQPHYIQLLRFGWYPASTDRPQTAATTTLLKFFHLLNFETKSSMYEFYNTLVRLTDNTGMSKLKDRYPAFVIIVREWRNLKGLKRGGSGHQPGGCAHTKPGGLAPICPACPHPGKNMSPGWESTPLQNRHIHTLYLAVDANFRLRKRHVSSEEKDPSLSDGWLYFTSEAQYKAYLKTYEKRIKQEKSTCSNHQAVNADRSAKGYAVSGVVAIDCARHDMKRPLAVGDLQKGERYINTDYLFFTSLEVKKHQEVVVSYDIVCQWSKKLWERMKEYPSSMAIPEDMRSNFRFLVPKFHLPSHIAKCQTDYSFNFAPGVGRTDGEALERGWARINPVAASTSEMGPGNRRDTLNDHFADTNWWKTASIAEYLKERLAEAIREAGDYRFLHNQFSLGLDKDCIKEWDLALKTWEADNSRPNPLTKRFQVMTIDRVRSRLDQEEERRRNEGALVVHERVSAVQMITMGLDLENEQRRLSQERKSRQSAPDQESSEDESEGEGDGEGRDNKMSTLNTKIQDWIQIQHRYDPSLIVRRDRDARSSAEETVTVTDIKLYLPSTLAQMGNLRAYDPRLGAIERQLRLAQAEDALDQLRDALRLRSYVYKDKDRFQQGQRRNMRSRGIVARLDRKVKAAADMYRGARDAVGYLAGPKNLEWMRTLPVLNDSDVRGYVDDDLPPHMKATLKPAEKKRLLKKTSKIARREGRQDVSWIWKRLGAHRLGDSSLDEDLKIEYCQSKTRAKRWKEEVEILQEEMNRVKNFFQWRSDTWSGLKDGLDALPLQDADDATKQGLKAYATEQSQLFLDMMHHCEKVWNPPILGEVGA